MPTKRNGAEDTSVEFDAFNSTVDRLLTVPKSEILRREAEYRKRADANPRKRGPKPKVKA
jgi:hypothetical protein